MTLIQQIFWGGLFLGLCLVLETALLLWCADALRRHHIRFSHHSRLMRQLGMLLIAIGFVVAAHTAHVWIWSAALVLKGGIFDSWNPAVYFSVATYTTLGYGDIVLDSGHRIFASFAAMTGMLSFGISTAFLVGMMRPVFFSRPVFPQD
ncbi:potassium channel family protein [Phaeobacter sp. HF9A]|uniref:potassium channel family protein n=1 Tax=Phaeobacter sp. HF9A TaxID=2721561 RepID=UPI001431643D|nr:potassium channel family protein [Phaeobacter sp. HF9A]NIZ14931.1 two pore domain potassium channel family protein [Phaeobacter sp. HF9A]